MTDKERIRFFLESLRDVFAKAAEDHKVKQPSLSACCLGKTKTCKGYKWEYENEND